MLKSEIGGLNMYCLEETMETCIVWKRQWRLSGRDNGGCLEETMEVVWKRQWRLSGRDNGDCLEETMEIVWKRQWRLSGRDNGGCLEETMEVRLKAPDFPCS